MLLDDPNRPLKDKPQLENWYGYHVWSSIIDACFLALPDVRLDRTESTVAASARRKNLNRVDERSTRAKLGPRLDGILRTADGHELMGIEAAAAGSVHSAKWLSDARKLTRAMRDMLWHVHKFRQEGDGPMQIVGISTMGLHVQTSRLVWGQGYVTILKRGEAMDVPNDACRFEVFLKLLGEVWRMREVARGMIDLLAGRARGTASKSDMLKIIMGQVPGGGPGCVHSVEADVGGSEQKNGPFIPKAMDTQSSS